METVLSDGYWTRGDGGTADVVFFVEEGGAAQRPAVEVTQRDARGVRLAQGLGWFSIGLGLTQLVAPRLFARALGIKRGGGTLVRLLGVRELLSGLGLLGSKRAVGSLNARIVGDVVDLALLGLAIARPRNGRRRLIAATAATAAAAGLDVLARRHLAADPSRAERVASETRVGKAITIDAEPADVYAAWRHLDHLSEIFSELRGVERLDALRSRWTARGPGGVRLRWEAEIVDDIPGELIAWTTVSGWLDTEGVVRFLRAPGGRGTEVVVEMRYHVRGRAFGRAAAAAVGLEPSIVLERGLRRLKQIVEIGEPMRARADEGGR